MSRFLIKDPTQLEREGRKRSGGEGSIETQSERGGKEKREKNGAAHSDAS